MMSRRTVLVTVVALVLFCASAYEGYSYRNKRSVTQQFEQAGWCCMLKQRRCVVAEGEKACRASGGASYTWDRSSCEAGCILPVKRKVGAQATPTTP